MAGEQEAVTFFQEWEAEVKAAVPEDRLLVFRVQEGWGPLADFLGLPQARLALALQTWPSVRKYGMIHEGLVWRFLPQPEETDI